MFKNVCSKYIFIYLVFKNEFQHIYFQVIVFLNQPWKRCMEHSMKLWPKTKQNLELYKITKSLLLRNNKNLFTVNLAFNKFSSPSNWHMYKFIIIKLLNSFSFLENFFWKRRKGRKKPRKFVKILLFHFPWKIKLKQIMCFWSPIFFVSYQFGC